MTELRPETGRVCVCVCVYTSHTCVHAWASRHPWANMLSSSFLGEIPRVSGLQCSLSCLLVLGDEWRETQACPRPQIHTHTWACSQANVPAQSTDPHGTLSGQHRGTQTSQHLHAYRDHTAWSCLQRPHGQGLGRAWVWQAPMLRGGSDWRWMRPFQEPRSQPRSLFIPRASELSVNILEFSSKNEWWEINHSSQQLSHLLLHLAGSMPPGQGHPLSRGPPGAPQLTRGGPAAGQCERRANQGHWFLWHPWGGHGFGDSEESCLRKEWTLPPSLCSFLWACGWRSRLWNPQVAGDWANGVITCP